MYSTIWYSLLIKDIDYIDISFYFYLFIFYVILHFLRLLSIIVPYNIFQGYFGRDKILIYQKKITEI